MNRVEIRGTVLVDNFEILIFEIFGHDGSDTTRVIEVAKVYYSAITSVAAGSKAAVPFVFLSLL